MLENGWQPCLLLNL